MPLNLDEIIAKSRAKTGESDARSTSRSISRSKPRKGDSRSESSDYLSVSHKSQGSTGSVSYISQGSTGSGRPRKVVTMACDMTDEEREAAAIAKIRSAMAKGGGGGDGGGGGKPKLKGIAKKMIMSARFTTLDQTSPQAVANGPDDPDLVPPGVVLDLWYAVADGVMDGNVDNKTIHSALETAKKYYVTSKEGREFVDKNLAAVTEMLLSQSPRNLGTERDRLGQSENDYVEKGVRFALQLVNDDLRTNAHKFTAKCNTLDALKQILDYKDVYYEDSPPEVRMDKILVFQRVKGFYHLAIYFNARANTSSFPEWEMVHRALTSSHEGIVHQRLNGDSIDFLNKFCKEAKNMTVGAMKHLKSMKKDALEVQNINKVSTIIKDIKQIHVELALSDPKAILEFFDFSKAMIVLLLPAQSVELKRYGQDMLHELIETVHSFRPAIGAYNVSGAGTGFVNGMYTIAADKRDHGGYVIPGIDVSYERVDPSTGKKLTLFSDTTFEEGGPVWCLSQEHDDDLHQPDYTDYYTVAPSSPQAYPPLHGWEVSDGSKAPAPTLQPLPKMIPIREEHKTIKEDLSRWLLEKKVPDLVIGADIGASFNDETISTLMESLDGYMKESSYVSAKLANLFVSILPSIQRQAAPSPHVRGFSQSSSSIAAIEAAKQRLASAERWEQNTSRALQNAQTEHKAATMEAKEARAYLERLDQQFQHSYQNGSDDRESSLRNVFETNDSSREDLHDSVDSSITSATGADHDSRLPTMKLPRRRIGRGKHGFSNSRSRRGSA